MLKLLGKDAAGLSTANGVSQGTPPSNSPQGGGRADMGVVRVALRQIMDNPYQPRTHYDAEHILNLAMSIKAMKEELPATLGLQQIPLARVGMMQRDGGVVLADRQMYATGMVTRVLGKQSAVVQLMFGHSRLRAFMVLAEGLRSLGKGHGIGMDFGGISELESRFAELLDADLDYAEMPLSLGFALDQAMWSHAITENSQRKNITAVEEAQSIQRAIDEFGLTAAEAGKPFGYARSTTANKLRLLQLPQEIINVIAAGDLTERHGRELLRLADHPERMKKAFDWAMVRGYTVAQLTKEVEYQLGMIEQEQKQTERQAQPIAMPMAEAKPTNRFEEDANATMEAFHASQRERMARQAEQLNNESHAVWMAWAQQQDPSALWNSIELWREMAKYNAWLPELIQASDNTHDACLEVLILLYKRTRRYDNNLGREVHYPHEVRSLIERLSGGQDD